MILTGAELVLHCLSFFRMSQWRLEQRVDALLSVSSAFEIVCTQTNFVSNGGLVNLINLFFETVAVGNEYNALPLQFSVAKLVTTAMVASENNRREVVRVIQDETFLKEFLDAIGLEKYNFKAVLASQGAWLGSWRSRSSSTSGGHGNDIGNGMVTDEKILKFVNWFSKLNTY